MIRIAYTVFFILFILENAQTQVIETEMRMSDGIQNALEVDLNGDTKNAEKIWKKYVKKVGKVDWDRKNKEHVLFNVIVPEIDEEYPVTVIAKFSSSKDMTKGTFWIKTDAGYLNSVDQGATLKDAGQWIQQYAYEVERKYIEGLVEKEEKNLNKLEKEIKKLIKENKKLHKTIEKAKETIAKAELNIEQNDQNQVDTNKAIEAQKKRVEAVKKELNSVGKKL